MNRYWWGPGGQKGIHWKAWDRLCVPKKCGGLGFKDLRAFNLAMLGKQAWRFLTRPQSLVVRIYKARYFPKSSFVDATLGRCPSFCWRSIMAAHDLICSGVRRRIGDGKSTLIWGQPWLPDDVNPMIQTAMPHELEGALVSGLIDPTTGSWDYSIVRDIFDAAEVDRIMKVSVSPHYEDSWFWLGDPGGCYTVKRGYRRIMGELDNSPGTFNKWLHLWKIKCPAKWKTFMWRALSNVLPTTTNLLIKRVDVDPPCPMCGIMHETIMHSLLLCDYSSLVSHESTLHVPSVNWDDFGAWFGNAITVLTEYDIMLVVAVLYQIWRSRNKAVWERWLPRPKSVWNTTQAATSAWRSVHTNNPSQRQPSISVMPAASAHFHCCFDAGFRAQSREGAVGAVLYAPNGNFTAAFNGTLPTCYSPLMAEALACKDVLSWLKGVGPKGMGCSCLAGVFWVYQTQVVVCDVKELIIPEGLPNKFTFNYSIFPPLDTFFWSHVAVKRYPNVLQKIEYLMNKALLGVLSISELEGPVVNGSLAALFLLVDVPLGP
ncbi:uncharacterized protein LOC115999450 [Ipomoea triloba]|uniref:uncharacterized protein LOC115999450 n=1 Tax=Ipomoea triloba TaxID=35885 RepID=UPI00125D437E|nr:uncharacterized protein LOC115999450 [Ipomoea triloba]